MHKRADVTQQHGSCCEWRGYGNGAAVLLAFSTSSFDPMVHPRETGRTTVVANQECTYVWDTINGIGLFGSDSYDDQAVSDRLSKILKGTMDI